MTDHFIAMMRWIEQRDIEVFAGAVLISVCVLVAYLAIDYLTGGEE